MICPKCNTKNQDGTKFCQQCGEALPERDEFDIRTGMQTPDTMAGMKTTVGAESVQTNLKKGTLFAGRYEILDEGLKGGMGMVYKVKDNTLQKTKALKIVLPEYLQNEKAISRFKQEVAITQELLHENIVRVYDIGQAEGTIYFTMEWIDGISLRDYINARKGQNKRFSLNEIIDFGRQICSALSYAHKTIIHRDIKPENILVIDPQSNTPKLKITDFGIAKTDSQTLHVSVSAYMGTPIYMAPEQYTDASHVDKRADVYSVGVVLYELMTFLHPLGTFPMPSEVNPSLTKTADEVIRKALSSDRSKRYEDAMDIIKELESSVGEEAQGVRAVSSSDISVGMKNTEASTPQKVLGVENRSAMQASQYVSPGAEVDPRKTKKNPMVMVAVVAGVIVILGGFFLYSSISTRNEQTRKDISQKEEKIREDARKAEEAAKKAELERQKAEAARDSVGQSIAQYLEDGKRYFSLGKYELSIEKMKEVLVRDSNNHEAQKYIQMAREKLDEIDRQFKNPKVGRSR